MEDKLLKKRAAVSMLINLYKSYPCLWKITSPLYSNKTLRTEAWVSITATLRKQFGVQLTAKEVSTKVAGLRSTLSKELKLLKANRRSGAGENDGVPLYEPTWWAFEQLQFLVEYMGPVKTSTSNLNLKSTTALRVAEQETQETQETLFDNSEYDDCEEFLVSSEGVLVPQENEFSEENETSDLPESIMSPPMSHDRLSTDNQHCSQSVMISTAVTAPVLNNETSDLPKNIMSPPVSRYRLLTDNHCSRSALLSTPSTSNRPGNLTPVTGKKNRKRPLSHSNDDIMNMMKEANTEIKKMNNVSNSSSLPSDIETFAATVAAEMALIKAPHLRRRAKLQIMGMLQEIQGEEDESS